MIFMVMFLFLKNTTWFYNSFLLLKCLRAFSIACNCVGTASVPEVLWPLWTQGASLDKTFTRYREECPEAETIVRKGVTFCLVSLMAFFTRWSFINCESWLLIHIDDHQYISRTTWICYVLLCCPSSRLQDDWSPPWEPGLVNLRLYLSFYRGPICLIFLLRLPIADCHYQLALSSL